MNMNLNLKLNFDLKTLLPLLRKFQPYAFGLLLVGTFAYTAYAVNKALNTQPAAAAGATTSDATKITFDKTAVAALKKLSGVNGDVPTGSLGSTDPFR